MSTWIKARLRVDRKTFPGQAGGTETPPSQHGRGHAHPALRLRRQFEYSSALPGARRRLSAQRGRGGFHEVAAPTSEELQVLLAKIITRIMRLLTKQGILIEEQDRWARLATLKDRTSPSSTDMKRGSAIGSLSFWPSWCVSKSISSWQQEGPRGCRFGCQASACGPNRRGKSFPHDFHD